jgi:hypothetical protein
MVEAGQENFSRTMEASREMASAELGKTLEAAIPVDLDVLLVDPEKNAVEIKLIMSNLSASVDHWADAHLKTGRLKRSEVSKMVIDKLSQVALNLRNPELFDVLLEERQDPTRQGESIPGMASSSYGQNVRSKLHMDIKTMVIRDEDAAYQKVQRKKANANEWASEEISDMLAKDPNHRFTPEEIDRYEGEGAIGVRAMINAISAKQQGREAVVSPQMISDLTIAIAEDSLGEVGLLKLLAGQNPDYPGVTIGKTTYDELYSPVLRKKQRAQLMEDRSKAKDEAALQSIMDKEERLAEAERRDIRSSQRTFWGSSQVSHALTRPISLMFPTKDRFGMRISEKAVQRHRSVLHEAEKLALGFMKSNPEASQTASGMSDIIDHVTNGLKRYGVDLLGPTEAERKAGEDKDIAETKRFNRISLIYGTRMFRFDELGADGKAPSADVTRFLTNKLKGDEPTEQQWNDFVFLQMKLLEAKRGK